jgi:hypothetical protein
VLSLSTLSTPTPLNDLKECNEHPWKTEENKKKKKRRLFKHRVESGEKNSLSYNKKTICYS